MPFETLPSDRRCGSHAEKNGSNSTTGWQHHSVSCKGQAWCLSIVSRADIHDKLHWLIQNSCNYPGANVGRLHIIVFFASFMFASSLVPSQLSKSLVLPSALIEETVHPTPLKLQPPNIRLAFQSCEHQEQHCWAVWNLTNLQIESHPKAHLRDGSLSRWKENILSKRIVSRAIQQTKKLNINSEPISIFGGLDSEAFRLETYWELCVMSRLFREFSSVTV